MSTMTIDERLDYLDALELADPVKVGYHPIARAAGEAGQPDYDKDAFVCLGSTVTVKPEAKPLTEQNKADVLNSMLLAQLAASKQYDRQAQATEWYDAYREVLEKVGWVVKAYDFKRLSSTTDTFTADQVVVEVLKSVVSQDVLGLISATYSALQQLGEGSEPVKMFESAASGDNSGNFQAYPIYQDQLGVGLAFSGYQLTTTETITRFLWFRFSNKSTVIRAAAQAAQLNEQVYAQVRATVLKKLGKAAQDFVDDLEI